MPDISERESLYLSPESGAELEHLQDFLRDFAESGKDPGDAETSPELAAWAKAALDSLPGFPVNTIADLSTRTYTTKPLQATSGSRTYRLDLLLDTAFGDQQAKVERCTQLMLNRVTEGRSSKFIAWAKKYCLTWRRSKTLAFPHTLPYVTPAPTTNEQNYAEEAGIIAAAFHFPLSKPAPSIKLTINSFSQADNSGNWTTGKGDVNHYNDYKKLTISLNASALSHANFDDDFWAGTIAHELMHNLGWGHPDGDYGRSLAIVNYKRCIEGHKL
jgi:hypothetical protein